jgi:AraC-like DNA-binding protein
VDALTGFLDGPRARGAFLLRAVMEPPWSLRIEDRAPLSVVVIVSGAAHIVLDSGQASRVDPGDVALLRGFDPYVFADSPTTSPQVKILPGQECVSLSGRSVAETMGLGIRTWGNSPSGSTAMLVGSYESGGEISRRITDALPALAVLRAGSWESSILSPLLHEVGRDRPGQQVVLDRMLDVLVVDALRAWFDRPESDPPAWYSASSDPVVGQALRLVHEQPEHPWTIAGLARACGVSRAGLARRFSAALGEPPMSYVAGWRLALAADLLRDPNTTVGSVAHRVGYGSPFTFSTAFKRVYGLSPSEYRRAS